MSLMAVEADRGRGWIADRLLIDFGFYEPCQVSQECRQPSTPHVCLAGKRRVYWWSVRPPTPKQFANQIFLAFVAGRHAVRSSLGFVWGALYPAHRRGAPAPALTLTEKRRKMVQ
jgi:hypothetical protein